MVNFFYNFFLYKDSFIVIIICIYVYIVMCNYLCAYIVMCDYSCLFLIKCVKLQAYIFTVCLKCTKRLINIYLHNNWAYIAQSYTLLYMLIMRLRLKNVHLLAWYFFSVKKRAKNRYCGNWCLIFAWDLGVYQILRFSDFEKTFFLNSDLKVS